MWVGVKLGPWTARSSDVQCCEVKCLGQRRGPAWAVRTRWLRQGREVHIVMGAWDTYTRGGVRGVENPYLCSQDEVTQAVPFQGDAELSQLLLHLWARKEQRLSVTIKNTPLEPRGMQIYRCYLGETRHSRHRLPSAASHAPHIALALPKHG